MIGFKLFS